MGVEKTKTAGLSFFDSINISILLVDSETGNIRYANPSACNFYGYSFTDFVKLNIGRLNPQSLLITLDNLAQAYRGEKDYYKTVHKSASGEDLFIGIYSGPFNYGDEKLVIALIHDNRADREAEDRLRSLSRAVEQSPSSIVITNTKGEIEYVNPVFTEVTGYSYEEAIGNDPKILKTGNGNRNEIKEMWQTILSGDVWHGEFCNRKKNGEIYWESASISPVLNEQGQLTNFVAVKEDITKIREDKIRIEEAYKFNRAILETSPIGMIIYRSDGQCISANSAAGTILGGNPDDLVKQNFNELKSWKEYGILDIAKKSIEKNEPIYSEFFYKSSFGKDVWMDLTCSPFRFDADHDLYLLFMFEDFTDRKNTEMELKKATEELAASVRRLEIKDQSSNHMREFGAILQVCNESEEAYEVIRNFGPKLFPLTSGCVFLMNESENLVNAVTTWGDGLCSELDFSIADCWSLRRGQLHVVESGSDQLLCKHVPADYSGSYIGLPMIASGDLTGLLHIEWPGYHEIDPDTQDLVQKISDMISLSLSNTRLRETLRNQSIRDPLTGVFNRRYLEETMIRELPRAKRKSASIGVMMLDIDHFKAFNDTHGHEAGDYVLKNMGDLLLHRTRKEDIVCRYGGEEFSVIMPEADLQTTYDRAELIRNSVNELNLIFRQIPLGKVTVSIGVAVYPVHGENCEDVIQTADKALYRAKAEGRNRVIKA